MKIIKHLQSAMAGKAERGFSWSAVVETVVILTVLLAINRLLLPDQYGFLSVTPHPFWAVVVFVSIRFGLGESLLSSLITAAVYSTLVVFSPEGNTPSR